MIINSKVRRIILISVPFIFSFFSSCIYYIVFSPKQDTVDFSNIILVFLAALGWSGQLLQGTREMYRTSYYLSAISIGIPILIFEIFKLYPYDLYQGRIIILMIIAANLWLIVINKNLRGKKKNN